MPQHRHSRPTITSYRTIGLHQRSYHISADTTTPPLPAWNAFPYPLKTTFCFSIGPFLEPLHHRFPHQSRPYQDRRPACTIRTFTSRQLRIREPATPRDGEPISQGIIESTPPPRFVCFYPRCRVDNSLQQPRVRVPFRVLIIFPSVTTFRLWFFWLTFHLVLFWSARLHALCWYFAPTYPPLV